ncbi:hypothetical protein PMAYCL1PPCAC_13272, partial [Pristionchus mayeri]
LKSSLLRGLRLDCSRICKASVSRDSKDVLCRPTVLDVSRMKADPGSDVEVRGWVKRVFKTGSMKFAHVSDGLSTDTVQVVIPRSVLSSVPLGAAIRVRGVWKESMGDKQECELEAKEAVVLATDADPRYADLSPDQLRKNLPLRTRSDHFAALLRMRSRLTLATHKFFQNASFVHVDTPILTENDCEGAGETFVVKLEDSKDSFFGHDVFLSVSSQLHLEAVTAGISRAYTIARAFRAEKNQSSTHMSEFSMLEVEVSLCESLDEMMDLAEGYLREMGHALISPHSLTQSKDYASLGAYAEQEVASLYDSLQSDKPFPRIKFMEALEVLKKIGHKLPESGSLSRSAELLLVEHFNGPVFVTHFPANQKPFYMKRNGEGETESFDLLCPFVGELAGGSLRVSTKEELERQCPEGKLPQALKWYASIRERGKPPSGGFGIGFERLLQTLLNIRNIKDTTAFPRWFKQCKC